MPDLPKVLTDSGHATASQSYGTTPTPRPQTTTSLPSFASFQEHAGRPEEPDEVEIAPMSARLSCYLCTKLKPMVREVAIAVAELDENVQTYCNKSITRVSHEGSCVIASQILSTMSNIAIDTGLP